MMGTVLMMLATYAAVKALGPALHTISARSDIRRAGTLSNLANSYIAQTGDMQPTIAKLVTAGLLPSGAKGVCATCGGVGTYTTNDGSVLSMVPGGSAGIFGMTLVPGPNMAQDMNYYLSHLTGSIQNGSTIAWNQPVPAIANLGSRFVQTNPANPAATQIVASPLSTGNNPIKSGSVNTGQVTSGGENMITNGTGVNSGLAGIEIGPGSGGVYIGNNGAGSQNFLSGMFVWSNGVCDGAGGCPLPWGYYPMGLQDGNTWRTGNGYGMNYYVGGYYCGYVYEAPGMSYGFSSGYHFWDSNCYRSWAW